MRFLIDMPLSQELAVWLRDQGHDAVHAADLGLARATDAVVLTQSIVVVEGGRIRRRRLPIT